jgi:hypothetical protein
MDDRIHKRVFLSLLASTSGLALIGMWRWRAASDLHCFYVAGVRFNPVKNPPTVKERVLIRSEEWCGRLCFGVYTQVGERIGYVPRSYISKISEIAEREWHLCAFNPDAVAWKRYKVMIAS